MIRRALFCTAILTAAALATSSFAMAQNSPSRIAPPSRVDQVPPGGPPLQPPIQRPGAVTAPVFTPFILRSVTITGSTLPTSAVEHAWSPFLGRTLDGVGLKGLSDAIAQVYSTSDVAIYSVLIPDQDLRDGSLRVKVFEGRVESVQLDRNRAGRAAPLAESHGAALTRETPLTRSRLQRELSLIRDIPGLSTKTSLLNGASGDGVIVKIDPTFKPIQGAVAINDRGTYLLGKTQVEADLYLNSLIHSGDQTRLTLAAPTEKDLFRFAALSHTAPLDIEGDTFLVSGSYLQTKPATTSLTGHATAIALQFSRPVIRSFDHNLYVTVGADGVNANNALFGSTLSDDRSRAVRLAAAYDNTMSASVFGAVVSVSHGFSGLGSRTLNPAFTDLSFTKANLRVSYSRGIGHRGALRLKAAAQTTSDPLPGSEQFSLGGVDYGRAYEAAVVSGDRGYGASAELAYRPPLFEGVFNGSEIYTFADGGHTTFLARGALPEFNYQLASAGGGVRFSLRDRAVIEVEGARGLRSPTAFLSDRAWRGVVSLRTVF